MSGLNFAAIAAANTDFSRITTAIYVGATGDVHAIPAKGSTPIVFKSVPTGTLLPIKAKQVTTASTANSMVAIF